MTAGSRLSPYTVYRQLPYFGMALSNVDLNSLPPGVAFPTVLHGAELQWLHQSWPAFSFCFIRYDWWN